MTIETANEGVIERILPERSPDLRLFDAPVASVTLLEDRARVVRRGQVSLTEGRNQLYVPYVSPVLQDVSLRAETSVVSARVADARVRRAMRIRTEDKPHELRALEDEIRALHDDRVRGAEDIGRLNARYDRAWEAMGRALSELSADAGWGLGTAFSWREGFEAMAERARGLRRDVLDRYYEVMKVSRDIDHKTWLRRALDRADSRLVAWAEIDVIAEGPLDVTLTLEYVCPNALWRPLHKARLLHDGGTAALEIATCAVVWQNTGEDWSDAELSFSTARASLGTEPPLLADDLLAVQRKREEVAVGVREVAIEKVGVDGGAGRAKGPSEVELGGVDDGGEVRNLRAPSLCTVPSDGRPNVIPLASFQTPSEVELVCKPEIDPKVIVRSVQRNGANGPLLPGPVELARQSGFVGYTEVPFIAPAERFELGFGPDDALRVVRAVKTEKKTDTVDKWTRVTHRVSLHVSNLGGAAKEVILTERIPVSEIPHVKIEVKDKGTTEGATRDDNGFLTWRVPMDAHGQKTIELTYVIAYAPSVTPP